MAKFLPGQMACHMAIQVFNVIGGHSPEKILPYDQALMNTMTRLGEQGVMIGTILVVLSKASEVLLGRYDGNKLVVLSKASKVLIGRYDRNR